MHVILHVSLLMYNYRIIITIIIIATTTAYKLLWKKIGYTVIVPTKIKEEEKRQETLERFSKVL